MPTENWGLTTDDLRLVTDDLGLVTTGRAKDDWAAGGDPKVGRPGKLEGGSAGWLTAQR